MQIRVKLVCGVAFGLNRLLRLDFRFCFYFNKSSGNLSVSTFSYFFGLILSVKVFSILDFLLIDFLTSCNYSREERERVVKVLNSFECLSWCISSSLEIRNVLSERSGDVNSRGGSGETSETEFCIRRYIIRSLWPN